MSVGDENGHNRAMRLLILGASDSEGTLLANFADSWREKLRKIHAAYAEALIPMIVRRRSGGGEPAAAASITYRICPAARTGR